MKKIILLILLIINSFCFAGESLNIKVPENLVDMYLYRNMEEGRYKGVYTDILKKVEKKSNHKLNYIFNEKNPDIALRIVDKTQYKDYNFIQMPINYRIAILVNNDGNIRKISDLQGLKIGYIENSRGIDEIEKKFSDLKFEKVLMKNRVDALESLRAGDLDGLILSNWIENNSVETKVRVIENILYNEQIAVKKDLKDVYKILEEELRNYKEEELREILDKNRIEFYKYVFKDIPNYKFIKEKYSEIKIGITKDKYLLPLFYKHNGKIKGILPKIMEDMEKILGIPFVITKDEDWDINGIIIENNDLKDKYTFTKPYYQNTIGIANRKLDSFAVDASDLDNEKIILIKDKDFNITLPKMINNPQIIYVETLQEGIEKLLNYEGNFLIFFSSMIEGTITNSFLENKIKVAGILNEEFSIGMGIRKEDEELGSIIRVLVESFSLDKTMVDTKANKNILFEKNYRLMAKIAVPTIIFIILLIILIIKSEKNRKKAERVSGTLIETFESIHQLDTEEAGDHSKRLALYAEFMAKQYGCSKKFITDIKRLTPFHDIGKIAISKSILNKPGKLTKEEFETVKKHTEIGLKLIKKLELGVMAENIIRLHHEKWNGKGYPLGLEENKIPLESRIVALADTYDNLRQDKVYRDGFTHAESVKIIIEESGKSFDPILVKIFEKNHRIFDEIFKKNNKAKYSIEEIFSKFKNK
ncbi:HD domain-containing phosphohydrolase [Fusobacterium sp.]|uniref:HD domain-containing phosphohydrolase n=1 Tax=Fusobacterium sp. TaxID=68766 RepID=UPI00260F3B08|nr:HD domain-containing phosphohydrolase [Fusobacterium sp.]